MKTIPDMFVKTVCFFFGHDFKWINVDMAQCENCGERRYRK